MINNNFKLENINRTICKLLQDCDNRFRNMFLSHRNNKTLLRAYASYLENCRWETDTAKVSTVVHYILFQFTISIIPCRVVFHDTLCVHTNKQLYEEANMLEEEDARRENKKKINSNLMQNPLTASQKLLMAKNKIVPAVRSYDQFEEQEYQIEEEAAAAEGNPAQDFVMVDEKPTDDDNWESVSVAGNEDEKKAQFYRAAINTREDSSAYRIWFAIFCVLSTLVVATCLITSLLLLQNFSKQISLQEKVCSLSGIPHLLNGQIRAVQARLNMASHEIDRIELAEMKIIARDHMQLLLNKVHDVQMASTSGEFIDQVVKTYTKVEWKYYVPTSVSTKINIFINTEFVFELHFTMF